MEARLSPFSFLPLSSLFHSFSRRLHRPGHRLQRQPQGVRRQGIRRLRDLGRLPDDSGERASFFFLSFFCLSFFFSHSRVCSRFSLPPSSPPPPPPPPPLSRIIKPTFQGKLARQALVPVQPSLRPLLRSAQEAWVGQVWRWRRQVARADREGWDGQGRAVPRVLQGLCGPGCGGALIRMRVWTETLVIKS